MNALNDSPLKARRPRAFATLPPLARLRFQVCLAVGFGALLPAAAIGDDSFWDATKFTATSNAFYGALACSLVSLALFRRLGAFPGITSMGQVGSAVAAPYVSGLIAIVVLRAEYSRPLLALSFASMVALLLCLWYYRRHRCQPAIYTLPDVELNAGRVQTWSADLHSPLEHLARNPVLVADLRRDLDASWQEYLLRAALSGIPVFHSKQVQESLLGKVEVEHLSENIFGSVNPNHIYSKVKRFVDFLAALIALFPLLILFGAVALAIKIDSRGPVFFVQRRVGRRGAAFNVIKFRSMFHGQDLEGSREAAKTIDNDPRITRVGAVLRRYRVDELPQIFNVLKGEMSWIGPRPEAVELSHWYEGEIPFYGYRHMVRPGITGWAQVHQGHVHDLSGVTEKLQYDFYYIKYLSWWLDALIVLRTLKTVIVGNGAR
ncbi:sugar transferase [Parafrankia sp. BMG5.11]|uniref:sugar transferase n=1 Tax=Parafrankia sp. BMG5.11 TaxID=222540 RepID=UPI00103D706E|nr:sugar transferase [Parafrankia sp. BMG5.11]TCJ39559.1 hypothetical protein E0504_10685 [Parafrankia sp. BMG5.11]